MAVASAARFSRADIRLLVDQVPPARLLPAGTLYQDTQTMVRASLCRIPLLALAAVTITGVGLRRAATLPSQSQLANAGASTSADALQVRAAPRAQPESFEDETAVAHDPESSWEIELRELKSLAALDAHAAFARVAAMSDKEERKAAVAAVCMIVSEASPDLALAKAWEFDLGRFGNEAFEGATLETIARRWADNNAAEVIAWAGSRAIDEESRLDLVWKGIALSLLKTSPAVAGRVVSDAISRDSAVQSDAAVELVRKWATRDFAEALAWAARLPDGHVLDRSVQELAEWTSDHGTAQPRF